jgi:5-(carboxyamino)imidazole ribonucleotide synthase
MIGGGQLSRMTAQAAVGLGVGFRVLAANATESAAQVSRDVRIGNHDELQALADLAVGADVVTFDHEHVPQHLLAELVAGGAVVRPDPAALIYAQDKALMRAKLTEAGIACPRWAIAQTPDDVATFAGGSWPVILKTSKGGYDGRGVWVIDSLDEAAEVMSGQLSDGAVWLVEEKVAFVQELAAQVARSPSGQAVAYPVVRTVQTDGICTEVVAPAPGLSDDQATAAQEVALRIAGLLGVTGMLAVELFDTGDSILVNELAMRPHNSGHWSIDGAVTSQFENHVRAVLDLPLGSPKLRSRYAVMVNVIGGDVPDLYPAYKHLMARDPQLRVHVYGKQVRAGRKVGHVTVVGDDLEDLLARAHHAADYLTGVIDE